MVYQAYVDTYIYRNMRSNENSLSILFSVFYVVAAVAAIVARVALQAGWPAFFPA